MGLFGRRFRAEFLQDVDTAATTEVAVMRLVVVADIADARTDIAAITNAVTPSTDTSDLSMRSGTLSDFRDVMSRANRR